MKTNRKKQKNKNDSILWVVKITIMAFIISLCFSFLSETLLPNVPLLIGILVVVIFVSIGIIFDMIGVAVTTVDDRMFHSMNAKKVREAKVAVRLTQNAQKVSSFCNDVIGDICGIISGSAGAIISTSISTYFSLNIFGVTLIVMALIAALTIGGKALGKGVALRQNEKIVHKFSKVISLIYCPKN